ncbi:hypothetical protein PIB30_060396 [Stylosanthes scabra]|uniref:Uncharacterized protein n=1 Tax=Stylosanthes scabra TaxID=79078 RepID=A0ABU6XII3_9FABA|nr:hypothetical protein [Stylosanthes scabra]
MKLRQEQFFENMQKAQSQYLEELKSLRTRQDEMVNQQNNFYRQIKREQEKTIKEIEEVKKFQVNQTLMGARRTTEEKLEEIMHETRNEIIEMRKQIRDWTRNASSREGYCCWAHQQANPNLVEIPLHKIPDFLHSNVANKKNPYFGALKSDLQQGEASQEKEQKEAWKARKEEKQSYRAKQSYSNKNRVLTPRRHYQRLGVAKPTSPFSLIQHTTPRRDARRLGMDGAARKLALHQGLNS